MKIQNSFNQKGKGQKFTQKRNIPQTDSALNKVNQNNKIKIKIYKKNPKGKILKLSNKVAIPKFTGNVKNSIRKSYNSRTIS